MDDITKKDVDALLVRHFTHLFFMLFATVITAIFGWRISVVACLIVGLVSLGLHWVGYTMITVIDEKESDTREES